MSTLIAHAGHPAEWAPFVAPIVLVALAWLVIRVAHAASPEQAEEGPDGDPQGHREDDARAGEEPAQGEADRTGAAR